jgi:hypothetical protein
MTGDVALGRSADDGQVWFGLTVQSGDRLLASDAPTRRKVLAKYVLGFVQGDIVRGMTCHLRNDPSFQQLKRGSTRESPAPGQRVILRYGEAPEPKRWHCRSQVQR